MSKIVKITTVLNPLNLLVPHSCRGCGHIGDIICDRCKNYIIKSHQNFCPICKTPNQNGKCASHQNLPPLFVVGYRHGLLDQLIHEYKYDSVRALSHPLAELVNSILPKYLDSVQLVPLPTTSQHIRARGFDHTAKIVKHLSRLHRNWQFSPILLRANNSTQVGSDRKTRLAQANSAYQINPKIKLNQEITYLLFDDVWTTGASIKAAIKKLRASGAKNIIVALLAVSEI